MCDVVCMYGTLFVVAVTEWIGKWKANGWRTVSNEDVKNKEDIQRLDSLCQNINVKWVSPILYIFRQKWFQHII